MFSFSRQILNFGEIQDGDQDAQWRHTPKYISHLVEHITGFLLKVKTFRSIVT